MGLLPQDIGLLPAVRCSEGQIGILQPRHRDLTQIRHDTGDLFLGPGAQIPLASSEWEHCIPHIDFESCVNPKTL